jgi:hypothetical protein
VWGLVLAACDLNRLGRVFDHHGHHRRGHVVERRACGSTEQRVL